MSEDSKRSLRPISDYLPQLRTILKERTNKPEMSIFSIPELNTKIWGIKRSKFTLIAARPGIGKSSFSLQVAYDLALQGKKILFLSLEMTNEDMLERLFCYEKRIDNQELMHGKYLKYESEFNKFCEEIIKLKFILSDCIGKTWLEVDNILNTLESKPDAVFIDHINAIKTSGKNSKADIDDYILNICTIAKHNKLAMVLCCQINRDNQKDDDKTPQLHELKGSGNLEEMADIVILLHWPFKYKKENQKIDRTDYQIIVAKNRNGPTGYINLKFVPEFYSFKDAPKEELKRTEIWEDK